MYKISVEKVQSKLYSLIFYYPGPAKIIASRNLHHGFGPQDLGAFEVGGAC